MYALFMHRSLHTSHHASSPANPPMQINHPFFLFPTHPPSPLSILIYLLFTPYDRMIRIMFDNIFIRLIRLLYESVKYRAVV